jgi:hypothetical protein
VSTPRETLEEKQRKSNRLAFWILGSALGCGCLWFIFAFGAGMAMGAYNAFRQQETIRRALETPTPDPEEHELRFSE